MVLHRLQKGAETTAWAWPGKRAQLWYLPSEAQLRGLSGRVMFLSSVTPLPTFHCISVLAHQTPSVPTSGQADLCPLHHFSHLRSPPPQTLKPP